MRLQDIFSLGSHYLKLGIAATAILTICFCGFYFLYYKKKHKDKKLDFKKLLLYGVFGAYIIVVLGATTMRGGGYWQGGKVMPLFYSYKEAWNTFAAVEWRNIILNILMFVPFGFLLPFLSKHFQSFWKTYLAGFLFTLLIESVQLIFKLGIFECDDLLNNFVGAMIGYGGYKIVQFVLGKCMKKEVKLLPVLSAQIPTILTITAFGVIFGIYQGKELGNLSCNYIYPLKNVEVESEVVFSEEESSAMVYQLSVASEEETRDLAEGIFAKFGLEIDESRTSLYDDTAIYYSTSDEDTMGKSMWIDYLGCTFSYTDFDRFSEDEESEYEKDTEADEAEIRAALEQIGIHVPEETTFQYDEKNEFYCFEADGSVNDHKFYQGNVTCEYCINGKIVDVNYYICAYDAYKEFSILSEQEAFEKLEAGLFQYEQADAYDVVITRVELEYITDSKGFYQPVYEFIGTVNGEEAVISIPAVE